MVSEFEQIDSSDTPQKRQQSELNTRVNERLNSKKLNVQQWNACVVWDFDGVINQVGQLSFDGTESSDPHYYQSELGILQSIYIPWGDAIKTVLNILHENNIKSVIGSQRNTYFLNVGQESALRDEMFAAIKQEFGKDNPFLTEEDAEIILADDRAITHIDDDNKNWILDAINFIPGCENIPAGNKILVDDNTEYKKKSNYQMVLAKYANKEFLASLMLKFVSLNVISFENLCQGIIKHADGDAELAFEMLEMVMKQPQAVEFFDNKHVKNPVLKTIVEDFGAKKRAEDGKRATESVLNDALLSQEGFVDALVKSKDILDSIIPVGLFDAQKANLQKNYGNIIQQDNISASDRSASRLTKLVNTGKYAPIGYLRTLQDINKEIGEYLIEEKPSIVWRGVVNLVKKVFSNLEFVKNADKKIQEYDALKKNQKQLVATTDQLLKFDYCLHHKLREGEFSGKYQDINSILNICETEINSRKSGLMFSITKALPANGKVGDTGHSEILRLPTGKTERTNQRQLSLN